MQTLKDLAEKARQQSQTQGELTSGSGRRTYDFAESSEYEYPNAGEYSESNTDVGKTVPNIRTVGILGEDVVAGAGKEASRAIQATAQDVLNITDPVLKKFIFGSDFVFNQTKLRSLNKLSGKVFNPVAIIRTIATEDDSFGAQLLQRALKDITGLGSDTTDGKTYYSAVDTDSQSNVFTTEGFKLEAEGTGGGGLAGTIASGFLDSIKGIAGSLIGRQFPSKSILGQVVAYDKDMLESEDELLDQFGYEKDYSWFKEEDQEDEYDSYTNINIDPIGGKAINYVYDPQLLQEDPVRYYKLYQDIRNGFYAQNVMVPKNGDILTAELKQLAESNKTLKLIFAKPKSSLLLRRVSSWYKSDRKRQFKPDDDNVDLTEKLYEHFFSGHISDRVIAQKGYKSNEVVGSFLKEKIENFFDDGGIYAVSGLYDTIYEREVERLDVLDAYGSPQDNPSDDQKLKSIKDTENYVDEKDHPEGYQYHNIEVKLSRSLKNTIRDKTFSGYRDVVENYDLSPDDEIMGSDISDVPAETLGDQFGTQQFMAIEDIRTDKIIYLRPTFENISEDIQINNGDFFYIGRTEPFPNYENTTRAITLSFKMYADTPNEYLMMWKKMDFLNSLAYPIATEADNFKSIQNPLLKFTVGNLFRRVGGYLNTLNYSYSNQDVTWETERGKIAPKIIDVSMSFTVLHDEMPFVHKNNEFQFDKSEGSQQFNFYDVDYSELNNGEE